MLPGASHTCRHTSKRGKSLDSKITGRGLTMECLNINSLLAHIDELKVFVSNQKLDIIAINETKLDNTIHDNEIYLPEYDVARKDRSTIDRNGGGVCFYIRSNLNFQIREDLNMEELECLTLQISNAHSRPFLVSTW